MEVLTSLTDLKNFLSIDVDSYDSMLWMLVQSSSRMVESYCDRSFLLKRVTEYYDGNGTSILRVKRYPIRDIHSLYSDTAHEFSESTLFDSDEYVCYPDMGVIRSLIGSFPNYPACIKIDYDGGYGICIESGDNDSLSFKEGGITYSVTITAGYYTPQDLASAIQVAMNEGDVGNTYSVSHTERTGLITISADGEFDLLLSNSTIAEEIGFDTEDQTGATSYTGSGSVIGAPRDIVLATTMIAGLLFQQSFQGDRRLGRRSRTIERGGTESFDPSHFPDYIRDMLEPYVRRWCL